MVALQSSFGKARHYDDGKVKRSLTSDSGLLRPGAAPAIVGDVLAGEQQAAALCCGAALVQRAVAAILFLGVPRLLGFDDPGGVGPVTEGGSSRIGLGHQWRSLGQMRHADSARGGYDRDALLKLTTSGHAGSFLWEGRGCLGKPAPSLRAAQGSKFAKKFDQLFAIHLPAEHGFAVAILAMGG